MTDAARDNNQPPPSGEGGSLPAPPGGRILLELVEHPFLQSVPRSVLGIFAILCLCTLVYLIYRDAFVSALVFVFMIISQASFFLPSRYVFSEEKITINRIIYRKSFPWSRFKSFAFDRNGLYLSPLSDPDRFDRFRGVFMVMGPENRKLLSPVLQEVMGGISGPGIPKQG
jgi:hypothetical protein